MWDPDDDEDEDEEESREEEDAHNRGEQDSQESRDNPKGVLDTLLGHADYQPPSDPDLKKHYDDGWDNARKQDYGPGGGKGR